MRSRGRTQKPRTSHTVVRIRETPTRGPTAVRPFEEERRRTTIRIDPPGGFYRTVHERRNEGGTTVVVREETYRAGLAGYTRRIRGNCTTYDRHAPPRLYAVVVRAEEDVHRFLAIENATVESLPESRVRIRGTGPTHSSLANVSFYTVTATVTADGLMRSLRASYLVYTAEEGRNFVRYTFRYSDVGSTTIEPPDWIDAARENLSDKRA
jgi:hypothetical protein